MMPERIWAAEAKYGLIAKHGPDGGIYERTEYLRADLAVSREDFEAVLAELRLFVARADAGEVRSKKTYARFKAILKQHGREQ